MSEASKVVPILHLNSRVPALLALVIWPAALCTDGEAK